MDDPSRAYRDASARVRATFYRVQLTTLLDAAFGIPADVGTLTPEEFAYFVRAHLGEVIVAVDPTWRPALERDPLPDDVRAQVAAAFATLRSIAQHVAAGQPTPPITVPLQFSLADRTADDLVHGWPRLVQRGRFADALLVTGLRLFSEVPRALIRACDFPNCPRRFVAVKRQRWCRAHQAEARRRSQQKAIRAFRARAKRKRRQA